MSKQKVLVTRKIPDAGLKLLKKKCLVTVNSKDRPMSKQELLKAIKGKDALLCLLNDKIDKQVIDANPNLKVIANYAVGYNNIDLKATGNIPVTNTPDVLTQSVAEHTFALMMAISKRIVEADNFTRAGKYKGWAPMLLLGTQMGGKTLGIVGLGRIGAEVARIARQGYKMNIIYYDVKKNNPFEKKYKAKYAKLNDLFKKSDFITIHVPLIPATKHLVNRRLLSLMKKSAYLINTSRGPVVEEKSLIPALKNNKIAGAALDVFECEPKLVCDPRQYSMFKHLKNVIVTPHIASGTKETRDAMAELAANNILRVLAGKKPLTPVKK